MRTTVRLLFSVICVILVSLCNFTVSQSSIFSKKSNFNKSIHYDNDVNSQHSFTSDKNTVVLQQIKKELEQNTTKTNNSNDKIDAAAFLNNTISLLPKVSISKISENEIHNNIKSFKSLDESSLTQATIEQLYSLRKHQLCRDVTIRIQPTGGIGNQLNMFTVIWLISSINKIPLQVPRDSIFCQLFTVKEVFEGQITCFNDYGVKIRWNNYQNINYKENKNYLFLNDLENAKNIVMEAISKNSFCRVYKHTTLNVAGHGLMWDYFFENKIYEPYMNAFNISRPNYGNITRHAKLYRYINVFMDSVFTPKPVLLEAMNKVYPNYNTTSYISVHGRFLGSMADFSDAPSRILECEVPAFIDIIKKDMNKNHLSKIYVAADSSRFKLMINNTLPSNVILGHLPSLFNSNYMIKNTRNQWKVLEAQLYAMAELYILRKGQSCIGSTGSSFSFIGCAATMKTYTIFGNMYHHTCDTITVYTE
ncbi:hypothetical protein WA158_004140 [Blastocystis sp. Blastoise]